MKSNKLIIILSCVMGILSAISGISAQTPALSEGVGMQNAAISLPIDRYELLDPQQRDDWVEFSRLHIKRLADVADTQTDVDASRNSNASVEEPARNFQELQEEVGQLNSGAAYEALLLDVGYALLVEQQVVTTLNASLKIHLSDPEFVAKDDILGQPIYKLQKDLDARIIPLARLKVDAVAAAIARLENRREALFEDLSSRAAALSRLLEIQKQRAETDKLGSILVGSNDTDDFLAEISALTAGVTEIEGEIKRQNVALHNRVEDIRRDAEKGLLENVFVGLGRAFGDLGRSINNLAIDAGEVIEKAAHDIGKSLEKGAQDFGREFEKGWHNFWRELNHAWCQLTEGDKDSVGVGEDMDLNGLDDDYEQCMFTPISGGISLNENGEVDGAVYSGPLTGGQTVAVPVSPGSVERPSGDVPQEDSYDEREALLAEFEAFKSSMVFVDEISERSREIQVSELGVPELVSPEELISPSMLDVDLKTSLARDNASKIKIVEDKIAELRQLEVNFRENDEFGYGRKQLIEGIYAVRLVSDIVGDALIAGSFINFGRNYILVEVFGASKALRGAEAVRNAVDSNGNAEDWMVRVILPKGYVPLASIESYIALTTVNDVYFEHVRTRREILDANAHLIEVFEKKLDELRNEVIEN